MIDNHHDDSFDNDNDHNNNNQREEAEKQVERQNNAKRLMEQNIEQLTVDTAEKQVMIMVIISFMLMIMRIMLLSMKRLDVATAYTVSHLGACKGQSPCQLAAPPSITPILTQKPAANGSPTP